MQIPEFVVQCAFDTFIGEDGHPVFWRDCPGGDEGYIVWWPGLNGEEGEHLHTYHYPPDVWAVE